MRTKHSSCEDTSSELLLWPPGAIVTHGGAEERDAVVTHFGQGIQDRCLQSKEVTLPLLCPPPSLCPASYSAGNKRLHFSDRSEGGRGSAQCSGGLGGIAGLSKVDMTAGRWCLQVLKLGGVDVEVQHGSLRRASAVGY